MLKILLERIRQQKRTIAFPKDVVVMPERYLGRPLIDPSSCKSDCASCAEICPTGAIKCDGRLTLDMGACIFCGECASRCSSGCITFTRQFEISSTNRGSLVLNADSNNKQEFPDDKVEKLRSLFGRSLRLRQVSAGGCNACEADVNVLNTVVFDISRFGIEFVASPRHADGLLITGPVPKNMELALRKTYEATPSPKLVIASGACAITGGIYAGNPEVVGGSDPVVPVDLYIPGCPPHPLTILDGLLRLTGRR